MVSADLVAAPFPSGQSRLRSVPGPTRLRLADLLHMTDRTADDVLSGRYDRVVPAGGVPTHDRWCGRLHRDGEDDARVSRAGPRWVPGCADLVVRVAG